MEAPEALLAAPPEWTGGKVIGGGMHGQGFVIMGTAGASVQDAVTLAAALKILHLQLVQALAKGAGVSGQVFHNMINEQMDASRSEGGPAVG
jgi:hypothetical protein